tara:strand:- start:1870 stop:2094 length:225 start_codon:yes stop_codon:yes gene_type:complete
MNSSYTIIFTIFIVLLILDSTKAGPTLASVCCGIQCGLMAVGAPACAAMCAAQALTCQGACGIMNCAVPTPFPI